MRVAPREVIASLADILPPDRMAMRSELEKLAIYVGKDNVATIMDVHAAVQDAGAAEQLAREIKQLENKTKPARLGKKK